MILINIWPNIFASEKTVRGKISSQQSANEKRGTTTKETRSIYSIYVINKINQNSLRF